MISKGIKRKKRLAVIALLTALASASLLSGCGKKDKKDSGTTTNTIANTTEQGTLDTTADSTAVDPTTEEPVTTEDPYKIEVSDKLQSISKSTNLFDLTELLPEMTDYYITDIATSGDEKVLILYQKMGYGDDPVDFSIFSLDVTTGEGAFVTENKAIVKSEDARSFAYVSFASVSPLVVYESGDSRFYDLENDKDLHVPVSFEESIDKCFMVEGQIYFLKSTGDVYRLVKTEDSYDTETAFEHPDTYKVFNLINKNGNIITLSAHNAIDSDLPITYMDVDILTGKIIESYTLDNADDNSFIPSYTSDIMLEYDDEGYTLINIICKDNTKICLNSNSLDDLNENDHVALARPNITYYSTAEKGIFFTASNSIDSTTHVYFWNYSGAPKTAYTEPAREACKIFEINEESVSSYIKELEDKYALTFILDSEQMPYVPEYDITPESDNVLIYKTLNFIDKCYSQFPDGFFEQLNQTGVPLRISIVNTLNGNQNNTISVAAGLVNNDQDGDFIYFSTLDGNLDKRTVYHETMHVIFNKMSGDGFLTDATDDWFKINPEGFEYGYTYNEDEIPDVTYTYQNPDCASDFSDVYFVNQYSKTYMTEDFAELFGNLMQDDPAPIYYAGIHMQEKCSFIFRLMRQSFDTTGWSEQTSWEKRLADAAEADITYTDPSDGSTEDISGDAADDSAEDSSGDVSEDDPNDTIEE